MNELRLQFDKPDDYLPAWLLKRLEVTPKVYEQQNEMFENGKQSCNDRIVSLEQPHVRPIVRGKRPNPTEFGQKVHLSVVEGYVYLEQISWNNFNESTDLIACVKEYKRRFGVYPKAVLADKIYQTIKNTVSCVAYACQAKPWAEKTRRKRKLRNSKCTVIPASGIGSRERTVY